MNKSEIAIEKTLINRLKNREREALEELYEHYAPILLSVSMRYTANKQDAEDVLHDAFIKILSNIDTFTSRFEGAFEGWMKRITANTSINFLRKKNKLAEINGRVYNESVIPNTETETGELPERIDPDTVIRFIATLPPGYRTVMNLYVFENYTHNEIAEMLNISINTSKSQLSKARASLRKKVIQYCNQQQMVEK